MTTLGILKKVSIHPDEPVLLITAEEAMENLLETIEEYCSDLEINRMTKKDIMSLLDSYANCVIDYHPESNHQERGALLENFEMLKNYDLPPI
jgi:KaiC/GvpD/RAD55 family RecA-like ATPase